MAEPTDVQRGQVWELHRGGAATVLGAPFLWAHKGDDPEWWITVKCDGHVRPDCELVKQLKKRLAYREQWVELPPGPEAPIEDGLVEMISAYMADGDHPEPVCVWLREDHRPRHCLSPGAIGRGGSVEVRVRTKAQQRALENALRRAGIEAKSVAV